MRQQWHLDGIWVLLLLSMSNLKAADNCTVIIYGQERKWQNSNETVFPGMFMEWRTQRSKTARSQERGGQESTACPPWKILATGKVKQRHCTQIFSNKRKRINYGGCIFGYFQGLNTENLRWISLLDLTGCFQQRLPAWPFLISLYGYSTLHGLLKCHIGTQEGKEPQL